MSICHYSGSSDFYMPCHAFVPKMFEPFMAYYGTLALVFDVEDEFTGCDFV
jgi:hypothetical protein